MFSSKKEDENKELNLCKTKASLFQKIAFEKRRTVPGQFNFHLYPIHWEKSRFDGSVVYGTGSYAGVPAAGVYEAKGSGTMFKPLHSEEACRKASEDAINEWTKCVSLLPEFSPKPKS